MRRRRRNNKTRECGVTRGGEGRDVKEWKGREIRGKEKRRIRRRYVEEEELRRMKYKMKDRKRNRRERGMKNKMRRCGGRS